MINSQMTSMSAIVHYDLVVLEAFFIGHALSTSVNLLVFPKSSRKVAFNDVRGYLNGIKKVLDQEERYVSSFENSILLHPTFSPSRGSDGEISATIDTPERAQSALKKAMQELTSTSTRLRGDLKLAKRDIAWGSITPSDLSALTMLLREILLGLRGMTALAPLFERLCDWRGWEHKNSNINYHSRFYQSERHGSIQDDSLERQEWRTIFRNFRKPVHEVKSDVEFALSHVAILLGLEKRDMSVSTADARDSEKQASYEPGDSDFLEKFSKQVQAFHGRRSGTLRRWEENRMSRRPSAEALTESTEQHYSPFPLNREDQEQFFVILYMQHLFHTLLDSTLELVKFAEIHRVDGAERKFVAPGRHKITKWLRHILREEDTSVDLNVGDSRMTPMHIVAFGDAFGAKKNPEHLPPTNQWQKAGNLLRKLSRFLSGSESLFGFRVACAVMCVAIIGLLGSTTKFFYAQRLIWAMILIPFSMTPTSGQSFSLLFFRIIGSIVAAIVSIANWYIVDGHPAGVLVFFYIFTFIEFYFTIKYPQYIAVWKVNLVTRAVMTGYALQTRKSGIQSPPATNSLHYPIYLIAPYRLATTIVGVFVAFCWTIFPAPVTSRSRFRAKLGQSLFLLATYYASMHATVDMYLSDQQGNMADKESAGRRLSKARANIFAKELTLLASLREHRSYFKYEITIGGAFPKVLYDQIIAEVDGLLSYMNLAVHAATTGLQGHGDAGSGLPVDVKAAWRKQVIEIFHSTEFASHNITTLLSLLASSVTNGQPLPPYLEPPVPYHVARQLLKANPELLSVKYALDPGFSAFAVIEVSSTMIAEGLGRLLGLVKDLVGEVDFGFKIEEATKPNG